MAEAPTVKVAVDDWGDLIQESLRIIRSSLRDGKSSSAPEKEQRIQEDVSMAWETLCDISLEDSNHAQLLSTGNDFVSLLLNTAEMLTIGVPIRTMVWRILCKLIANELNVSHFSLKPGSTFTNGVVSTIQHGNEEIRAFALSFLARLSKIPSNRVLLSHATFNLFPVLSVMIQYDTTSVTTCCEILASLADDKICCLKMCSIESNILATAGALLSATNTELVSFSLELLNKISLAEDCRIFLVNADNDICPQLLSMLSNGFNVLDLKPSDTIQISNIIFNLSKSAGSCAYLTEMKADFFPVLINCLIRDKQKSIQRVFCLYTILNMIKLNIETRDYFGCKYPSFFNVLLSVLQEPLESNNAVCIAMQILTRLAFSKEVRLKLIEETERQHCDEKSDDLVTMLIRASMQIIELDEGIGRVSACSFIWNVIADDRYHTHMHPMIPDLVPILIHIIHSADNKTLARGKALGIMVNIIRYGEDSLKILLAKPEYRLVDGIVKTIESETSQPDDYQKAVNILDALCFTPEIAYYYMSESLGLLPSLVKIAGDDSNLASRMHACSIFWNLAVHDGAKLFERTLGLNLIPILIKVVVTDKDNGRYKALGALCNISILPAARPIICCQEYGMLNVISSEIFTANSNVAIMMINMLCYLTLDTELLPIILSPELNLVSALIACIDRGTGGEEFITAVGTSLWNVSCVDHCSAVAKHFVTVLPLNKIVDWIRNGPSFLFNACVFMVRNSSAARIRHQPQLARDSTFRDIISIFLNIILKDSDVLSDCALGALWNFAEIGDVEYSKVLVEMDVHKVVLDIVRFAGPDENMWANESIVSKAMNFLMNISRHDVIGQSLKDVGVLDVVIPILLNHDNGASYLKAMVIVAFLVGRDEVIESVELLQCRSDTFSSLIQVLTDTLEQKESKYYPLGTFCIKLIVQAALALSISDANKQELIKTPIIVLLSRILTSFVNGDPEVFLCGGEDVEAASLSVKTLLHLSFVYENELDLQTYLMPPELNLLPLLQQLLLDDCSLSSETKRTAGYLIQRLLPLGSSYEESKHEISDVPPLMPFIKVDDEGRSSRSEKHIMVSYCQHETANPQLVRNLVVELRNCGYDVWIDSEGSKAVPPISGYIDDCMALAVECSDAILICVSCMYKQSSNCRFEANYASALSKRPDSSLKLYYVMMNEHYTTISSPLYCDGWLGLMIGTSIWYPLWGDDYLKKTVKDLCAVLGTKGKSNHPTASKIVSNEIYSSNSSSNESFPIASSALAKSDTVVFNNSGSKEPEIVLFNSKIDSRFLKDESTKSAVMVVSDLNLNCERVNEDKGLASLTDDAQETNQSKITTGTKKEVSKTLNSSYFPLDSSHYGSSIANEPIDHNDGVMPSIILPTCAAFSPSQHSGYFTSGTLVETLRSAEGRAERMTCMWKLITSDLKVKDKVGLARYLASLGISESEELEYCDIDQIHQISSFLLPIPQKMFVKKMSEFFAAISSPSF